MAMWNEYSVLIEQLRHALRGDPFWESYTRQWETDSFASSTLHLAILVEPYLQFVLDGRKTVESRFSSRRCAPYDRVRRGDTVLLKRSGGAIVGLCQVTEVWSYQLDPSTWQFVRQEFTDALCAQDPGFWAQRERASFATLMRLQHVRPIEPVRYSKRDRRGWVVLRSAGSQRRPSERKRAVVLAFSGGIASGKSTLSTAVAEELGCPRVSFGDYVRLVAERQGLDQSRRTLQEIGASLIKQGTEPFYRSVLSQVAWEPGQSLVVDGIRHSEGVPVLRSLVAPSHLVLVYVAVDRHTRQERSVARANGDLDDVDLIDTHSTEVQVGTVLPAIADLTVDGTRPVEELVREITGWVRSREVAG